MSRQLKRRWTDDDIAELLRLRDVERMSFPAIDKFFGRSASCSKSKYESLRSGPAPRCGAQPAGGRIDLSPDQEAALSARKDAENRMSMTATFFGDPPPGYSALDRRGRDTR